MILPLFKRYLTYRYLILSLFIYTFLSWGLRLGLVPSKILYGTSIPYQNPLNELSETNQDCSNVIVCTALGRCKLDLGFGYAILKPPYS